MERRTRLAVIAALAGVALLLSACALLRSSELPGNAAPVVKIGVIAPFEGEGRGLGYAVLPAIKSVVAEANASGRFGSYRVAVVAFNDDLDAKTAAEQARALALDPGLLVVLGPVTRPTINAAVPILSNAGIVPVPILSVDPLNDDYSAEIAAAKAVTQSVVDALAADIAQNGRPTRDGVARRLAPRP